MAEYDNKGRFTLFRNTKKREGKNDADFTGSYTDDSGREYWVSAWSQTPKSGGDKFLSGSIRMKDATRGASAPPQQKRVELSDEVPFEPEFR